jgi:alkanesulfonate monooxygenase SsuD/methylene tetrahydromethanopterin reductase-like flavin-dependent oxidoreductase (luciferase family)
MKYGFVFPKSDPVEAVHFAQEAEAAGWDAFFVWEGVWGVDAWVTLGALAVKTERIRLGTMLTPPSRRRPWKLASEALTVDLLSNGRTILAVGLGAPETGFAAFGEETDRKTRAELMDEALAILTGLWRGQPFSFAGKHYQVTPTPFHSPPGIVQQPRIPIWVVGAWPREKSMRRVLQYDGLLPNKLNDKGRHEAYTAEDVRAMRAYVEERRQETTPFDIVVEGKTPGDDPEKARATVAEWQAAGATWWIEADWEAATLDPVLERIRQGPPRGRE